MLQQRGEIPADADLEHGDFAVEMTDFEMIVPTILGVWRVVRYFLVLLMISISLFIAWATAPAVVDIRLPTEGQNSSHSTSPPQK